MEEKRRRVRAIGGGRRESVAQRAGDWVLIGTMLWWGLEKEMPSMSRSA